MTPPSDRTTIAMCTFNGAPFLPEQLMSFVMQTDPNWDLWISDDGSTDSTLAILENFRQRHGANRKIHILQGPRRGAAQNFLGLLHHADFPNQRVALSDQDDIWRPNRLQRVRQALQASTSPTLYAARSLLVDAQGAALTETAPPRRGPSFTNALVQNIVSGHTAALCPHALKAVRNEPALLATDIPFHDWWLYLFVTAIGGTVALDPETTVLYRQHDQNVQGAGRAGLAARANRLGQLVNGQWGKWIFQNRLALAQIKAPLSPAARQVCQRMGTSRVGPMDLWQAGLHRQSPFETIALYGASLLGKL